MREREWGQRPPRGGNQDLGGKKDQRHEQVAQVSDIWGSSSRNMRRNGPRLADKRGKGQTPHGALPQREMTAFP